MTRDALQCLVDLSLVWRPVNVARSLLSARDAAALVGEVASLELRAGIGRHNSGELFAHRTEMEDEIKVSALFSEAFRGIHYIHVLLTRRKTVSIIILVHLRRSNVATLSMLALCSGGTVYLSFTDVLIGSIFHT